MPVLRLILAISVAFSLLSCANRGSQEGQLEAVSGFSRVDIYAPFKLTSEMKGLNKNQKRMLSLLIEASQIMDDLFWKVSFGESKERFLTRIPDQKLRKFAELNYGPWDRLDGNKPYIKGYGPKPLGAQFYPSDVKKTEIEKSNVKDIKGIYSVVTRGPKNELIAIPYNIAYNSELQRASYLWNKAAELARNKDFKKYLKMRAKALISNEYQASDMMWMDMKNNPIDVVIGPIETYEDQLFGYRAAFEAYVLVKDMLIK